MPGVAYLRVDGVQAACAWQQLEPASCNTLGKQLIFGLASSLRCLCLQGVAQAFRTLQILAGSKRATSSAAGESPAAGSDILAAGS